MENQKIDINFFPLQDQNFNFDIYIQKAVSNQQKSSDFGFEVKRFKIDINNDKNYNVNYFVTFEKQEDFILYTINSKNNNSLTIWYLYHKICNNAKHNGIEYISFDKYEKMIDFITNKTDLGNETITIIPKCINTKFGFLVNYHFRMKDDVLFSREVQKMSLSLDSSGKPNKNYYSDKYAKIISFVNSVHYSVLTTVDNQEVDVNVTQDSLQLDSDRLNVKKYVFGNLNNHISQFKGIETFGPYQSYPGNPLLCFVFRNEDKELSYKLYYALQGKTYPTFSGMEKTFNFAMNKENVIGISVNDYSESEINKLILELKTKSNGRYVIPIILVPWNKEKATEEQSMQYYLIKHHLLKVNMPSQFVGIPMVANYENLKWSVSSIGLQIFTKLGGSPWCLETTRNKSLIIGIGQSHRKNNHNSIEKYFSYSVMTDSSGIFQNIKVLSENKDKNEYLNGLAIRLKEIILEKIQNYDNFVIHTSFRLQDQEMAKINEVIESLSKETCKYFTVMRFSDSHNYMGFNITANSKTPLESTVIRINKKEFLVWFEGLSSATNTIKTRIGPPMHLTVDYPKSFNYNDIWHNLQDAINLSGANWRGFNAKTTPVSILYARLLSSFIAAFDKYGFEEINIEQMTPWFL